MSARSDQVCSRYLNSRTKRCFDILVCVILFLPSLILIGFLALIVLVRDGLPVFFVQRRVGRNGTLFWMPKLRTLPTDADPYKPSSSFDDSLLISATGKFLRRHRLDELPQLLSVLTGHMSLVGPRPDLPHIATTYRSKPKKRVLAKPGISGLWQVMGNRELGMHQDIKYDLYYIRNASLWLDVKILLMTIPYLVKSRTEKTLAMKVGYILTTFPCQSEIFAAREIESLRRLGIDVTVLAVTDQKCSCELSRDIAVVYRPAFFSMHSLVSIGYLIVKHPLGNIKLAGLIFRLVLLNPKEAKLIVANFHTVAFFARALDKRSPLHIHAYFLNWPSCIAMALAIVTRRPFSIAGHARDLFVERGALKLKASYASFIVTCTQYGLDYLKRRLPATFHSKLHLVYHSVNVNPRLSAKHVRTTGQFNKYRLVAAGRLVPKKGFDYLIKAFSLVRQSFQNCTLLIVGDGPEYYRLSALVDEIYLKDDVKLLGWLEHNKTLQLIRSSTILVVPSIIAADGDRDGIPNVILEAFASSVPVVASNLEGIAEAVVHRQTGLLVEPRDVSKLASAIKDLLDDGVLRNQLSHKAYEFVKDCFDPEKNASQLAELFIGMN